MGKLSKKSQDKGNKTVALKKDELSYTIDPDIKFTGNQLYQCPKTGFLGFIPTPRNGGPTPNEQIEAYKQGGANPFVGFTPAKKVEFINAFPKYWPNVSKCLKAIDGPQPMTFTRHKHTDPLLAELVENINRENVDDLKNNMVKFSKRPKNFMDRMAVGRLYAPEEFDPARRLIVENRKSVDTTAIQTRITHTQNVVDAEIVGPAQLDPPAQT